MQYPIVWSTTLYGLRRHVFPACGADDLRVGMYFSDATSTPGCYIDSAGGVSYIGGNIFGDKHIVNPAPPPMDVANVSAVQQSDPALVSLRLL